MPKRVFSGYPLIKHTCRILYSSFSLSSQYNTRRIFTLPTTLRFQHRNFCRSYPTTQTWATSHLRGQMQSPHAPSQIAFMTSLASPYIVAEHGTLTATERAAFDRIRQRIEVLKRLESFRSSNGNLGSDTETSLL